MNDLLRLLKNIKQIEIVIKSFQIMNYFTNIYSLENKNLQVSNRTKKLVYVEICATKMLFN